MPRAPIAPAASSVVGSIPATEAAVTIGVDGSVAGFNPHAIADYSPADEAVADLVLPSVSTVASNGSVQLNRDVVDKAEVTSTDPFTVTYTLDRNAAWSDGTPITAEDFSYLRDQMLVQPGTVDPAGYRLITSIVSRDAGKSVDVKFAHPVADWLTLFSPLLPAHILKDSPGGWTEGLATAIPVSGNRYKMQSNDAVTGEITLVRNDKYWGTPPGPSTAIFRIGTAAALIDALSRGDLQAVLLQPDASDQRSLEKLVPVDRWISVGLPGTVQLVLNNATGATADQNVRKAIAAGLDLPALRAALTGANPAGATPAPSLVSLSATGTSQIVTAERSAAITDLTAAGYRRDSLYMSKDGEILRLTLAYPSNDVRMAQTAELVQSQLEAIGIEVDLLRDSPRGLVDSRLATGKVDLGLVLIPRGPADALAAAFGIRLSAARRPDRGDRQPRSDPAGRKSVRLLLGAGAATAGAVGIVRRSAGRLGVIAGGGRSGRPDLSPDVHFCARRPALAPLLGKAGPGWVFSGPLSTLPTWPAH